jgi:hypothetical protein
MKTSWTASQHVLLHVTNLASKMSNLSKSCGQVAMESVSSNAVNTFSDANPT